MRTDAIVRVCVLVRTQLYTGLLPDRMVTVLDAAGRSGCCRSFLLTKSEASVFAVVREREKIGLVCAVPQLDKALKRQGFTGVIEVLYVLQAAQRTGVGRHLSRQADASFRHDDMDLRFGGR